MLPAVADQVTAVLLLPVTLAVNCCVPLLNIEADTGEIVTATTGAALTVTSPTPTWSNRQRWSR